MLTEGQSCSGKACNLVVVTQTASQSLVIRLRVKSELLTKRMRLLNVFIRFLKKVIYNNNFIDKTKRATYIDN